MAKRKKPTKKSRVDQYMADNPAAGPKDVAAALKKFGISAAYVSNIKTSSKKAGGGKRAGKRGGRRAASSTVGLNVDTTAAAWSLLEKTGSIDAALEAVRSAEKLQQAVAAAR